MSSKVKKALLILCLVLIICGAFVTGYSIKKEKVITEELPAKTSILTITYPPNELKVSDSLGVIAVKGMTFADSVKVNGKPVPVVNSTFMATAELERGVNSIVVEAVKGARIDRVVTTVTRVSYPMTVYDDFGRKVTVKEEPERIVSIAPSNTEILFALRLGDKVVGVTTYCDYPAEATTKEKVGGFTTVNIEKVVSLQPDLVFAAYGQREIVQRLEEANQKVIAFNARELDDVFQSIRLVGLVTNASPEAENLVPSLQERLEKVTSKALALSNNERIRVYYEMWYSPYITCGPGSFVNDLIYKAGGSNIAASTTTDYPTLTEEFIITANPQVIITTKMNIATPDDIKNRTGWDVIDAVKNDRVYFFDGNLFERAGPRLLDGLELLAELLHPELFPE